MSKNPSTKTKHSQSTPNEERIQSAVIGMGQYPYQVLETTDTGTSIDTIDTCNR